jgi:hypothetical protein
MAVTASVTAVLAATIGAVTNYTLVLDRRSFRDPIGRLYSLRTDTWERVQADPLYEGWFRSNLRCSKATFEIIVHRIESEWEQVNDPLHWNAHFLCSSVPSISYPFRWSANVRCCIWDKVISNIHL